MLLSFYLTLFDNNDKGIAQNLFFIGSIRWDTVPSLQFAFVLEMLNELPKFTLLVAELEPEGRFFWVQIQAPFITEELSHSLVSKSPPP